MDTQESIESFADLICCKSRSKELQLPEVKRIKDIREFMANKKSTKGGFDGLIDRMNANFSQCDDVLKVLKEKLNLKLASLRKVKQDMMELNRDLKTNGATKKYVTEKTKITVRFMDEVDVLQLDIPSSLERYNNKIDSLFNEILGLDGDIDYVNFLTGIARLNVNYVQEWIKMEQAASAQANETELESDSSESL
ncbi:uncharacterized protein Dana_GF11729 [Drosophila ananassae]|uniref:Uncharacterized protein n=1 Tax=Drosophila ananassae TaxID=7217 RepID=B3MH92_DROAN|nr:uncharacterized protein LOC6494593 [Drosophila ananassae]EDV36869.1 uncharacterized protein Dana_GF11729 [Drosophila ananassae]